MLNDFFMVGCGGFVGSVARYYIGGLVYQLLGAPKFPVATIFVNIVGCLVIGFLGAIGERQQVFTASTRLLIFTGVLGGFTTFSAFGFDTIYLIRSEEFSLALMNVLVQLIGGLVAVWFGSVLASRLFT